jgi:hypothetical protein
VPYPEGSTERQRFWEELCTALELPVKLTIPNEANSALGLRTSRFLTTLFHPSMAPHVQFGRPERLNLLMEIGRLGDTGRVQPSKHWALGVLDGYKHSNRLLRETFVRGREDVFNLDVSMYPEQSSGVMGMRRSEFFEFLEAAPEVADVIANVGKLPDEESFYDTVREKTQLL